MTREEPTVESVLRTAAEAGLPLTQDEAEKLLPGIKRNRGMAEDVRKILTKDLEPAVIYGAEGQP